MSLASSLNLEQQWAVAVAAWSPLYGGRRGHGRGQAGHQDLQPLLVLRQVHQDLLVEPPEDGGVEAPGQVGGGQEEDTALALALQAVELHQELGLTPATGLGGSMVEEEQAGGGPRAPELSPAR